MSAENTTTVYAVHSPNKNFNQVIDAESVSLLPMNMRYVDDICSGFTPQITEHLYTGPVNQNMVVEGIKKNIQEMKNNTGVFYVIRSNNTGEFLGCAGIRFRDEVVMPKLWIKETMWQRGYGSQVFKALLYVAHTKAPGKKCYITVDKRNIAAKCILKRHGITRQLYINPRRNASNQWVLLYTYVFLP